MKTTYDPILFGGALRTEDDGSSPTPPQPAIPDKVVISGIWNDLVIALESGLYTYVAFKGNYLCTDNEPTPLNVHANVKRISGSSMAGTVIDADCATNGLIQNFMVIPSDDCEVENFTIKNFGTGAYAAIQGTRDPYFDRQTVVKNILIKDMLNASSYGFRYCDVLRCQGENASSVGIYGRGSLTYECKNVFGCKTNYFYYLDKFSYNVIGNVVMNCGTGVFNAHVVSANTVEGCWNGFQGCAEMDYTNRVYAYGSVPYQSCIFNATYRDNTDNTKKLTKHYELIASGAERDRYEPDLDGTYALMNVENDTKFQISSYYLPLVEIEQKSAGNMAEARINNDMGPSHGLKIRICGSSYAGTGFMNKFDGITPISEPYVSGVTQSSDYAMYWGVNDKAYFRVGDERIETYSGIARSRTTVTGSISLDNGHHLISVKPIAVTDVTLPVSPVDGQEVEIYAVNLDYVITIKGSIDGITDLIINNAKDNIRLIYNSDELTWESR